jgi:hypothetical protein
VNCFAAESNGKAEVGSQRKRRSANPADHAKSAVSDANRAVRQSACEDCASSKRRLKSGNHPTMRSWLFKHYLQISFCVYEQS